MRIESWQLDSVNGGRFRLDGGVMCGVVPKSLWSQRASADAENRIAVAGHCVLARNGRHTVLVDTGFGTRLSPLEQKFYDAQAGEPLAASLAELGVAAEEIDVVLLSHLHFDHVGGASRLDGAGRPTLTFPRARHLAGRIEWDEASRGAPELGAAYQQHNLTPLADSRRLELLDDGDEVLPGLRVRLTGGHTLGHLAIEFGAGEERAIFIGDLCPSRLHLRRMWSLSYDLYPLETRRQKPRLLGEAADCGAWLLWSHDAQAAASRVARHPRREFVEIESLAKL